MFMLLYQKINHKNAVIAVIGLGYVGLPLVKDLLQAGFTVIGLDIDAEKVKKMQKGAREGLFFDKDIAVSKGKFTTNFKRLQESDIDIICVPTPLHADSSPDISSVQSAAQEIARNIYRPKLVIIESTIYTGALRETIYPPFIQSGLLHNRDFYLAYAPERIDPGNKIFRISNTPRIVGGMSKKAVQLAAAFYKCLVDTVIEVSSPEIAETAKLLENSFRCINIAFINEVELLCRKKNINIYEVLSAAASKPFGYMPFYPGPGVGGHCITADPLFLAWLARKQGTPNHLLELAATLNRERPRQIVSLIAGALQNKGKDPRGARILLLGIAYKKNVADTRESPALKIFEMLQEKGAIVKFYDPFVPQIEVAGQQCFSTPLTSALLQEMDCVVITTDHDGLDYAAIKNKAPLLLDIRGASL